MRADILGTPIDWFTNDELARQLVMFVITGKPHHIATVNPEFIVEARHNPAFADILKHTDLNLPDGAGIIFAQTFIDHDYPRFNRLGRLAAWLWLGLYRLLGGRITAHRRQTGVDLVDMLIELAAKQNWSIYLLGGRPGVAEAAAKVWRHRHPNLKFVGTSSANPDDPNIVTEITGVKPDILLVAYGAPKQEQFITQHKASLKVPIMVGVGGTFDYAAGVAKRPPFWIRNLGLEWLYRLVRQPRRVGRIWRATIGFTSLIINAQYNT